MSARKRGECHRCRRTLTFKARGMCDSCYNVCSRNGTLHEWPYLERTGDTYPYCTCPEGTPVVSLFGLALQCGECSRKVFGKDEPIPESVCA